MFLITYSKNSVRFFRMYLNPLPLIMVLNLQIVRKWKEKEELKSITLIHIHRGKEELTKIGME